MQPRQSTSLAILALVLILGCNPKEKLARNLSDLEQQIEVKEQELNELRKRADAIRTELDAHSSEHSEDTERPRAKRRSEGKTVTVEQLIAGLPENARPNDGGDKVRLGRANAWLAENATGKNLRDRHIFVQVALEPKERNRFTVNLYSADWSENAVPIPGIDAPPQNRTAEQQWQVMLRTNAEQWHQQIVLEDAEEKLAERLFDLERKPTVVEGEVEKAELVSDFGGPPRLRITLADITIEAAP